MNGRNSCMNCRFMDRDVDPSDEENFALYCRRLPPAFLPNCPPELEGYGMHPIVEAADWCGEWGLAPF